MAWIESHTVLIRHRKVIQLAEALSLDPVTMIGHLHAFWHTVLEQQEDGDLSEWSDMMIARAAYWTGDASLFVRELQSKKWLDGKLVHDWLDYTGRYLTNKYKTGNQARLQAIYKLHAVRRKSASSRTKVRQKSSHLPNLPNLTKPNQPHTETRACGFDSFWEAYPKKKSKGQAEKAWKSVQPDEQLQAQILAALKRAMTSADWVKDNGRYIPYPATWLHAKGWTDEEPPPDDWREQFLRDEEQGATA